MQLESTSPRRRRLVSLTPLIDVVFILLVFFMLASTFTEWRAMELAVPAEATEPHPDQPEPLVVKVAADGLQLDGDPLSLGALVERVGAAVDAEPERGIIVRPGDDVRLQRVVTVMERLNAAGGTRISLQREE